MNNKEAQALLLKYQDGKCTAEEKALLESWFIKLKSEQLPHDLPEQELEADLTEVWGALKEGYVQKSQVKLWPQLNPALRRGIAAAAAILLVIGAGVWFFYSSQYLVFSSQTVSGQSANDIAPGKNTATLTLANGKTINLSDAKTGVVIGENNLAYNDGSLVQVSVPSPGAKAQLIASTPRGGTYQVILPDGSKVWLNAASSLKFPSSFANTAKRHVELNGEAYFEVAKDKKHPFIVQTGQQEIMVLGTHFNVSAYRDETANTTTLLEGSVHVSRLLTKAGKNMDFAGKILIPGQQSVLTDQSFQISNVDTEEAVAWKNGYFRFNKENIVDVMRKISRWYNIEVAYEGPVSQEEFSGTASRNKSAGQVLKMLQYSKSVQFKVEGRRVTVTK
jgi:transmembrane sensor